MSKQVFLLIMRRKCNFLFTDFTSEFFLALQNKISSSVLPVFINGNSLLLKVKGWKKRFNFARPQKNPITEVASLKWKSRSRLNHYKVVALSESPLNAVSVSLCPPPEFCRPCSWLMPLFVFLPLRETTSERATVCSLIVCSFVCKAKLDAVVCGFFLMFIFSFAELWRAVQRRAQNHPTQGQGPLRCMLTAPSPNPFPVFLLLHQRPTTNSSPWKLQPAGTITSAGTSCRSRDS